MKIKILLSLFALVAINGVAQSYENDTSQVDRDLTGGGLMMLMTPAADPYDSSERYYQPQTSWIWMGNTRMNNGISKNDDFHEKSMNEVGITFFMISRCLSRHSANTGISAGLQFLDKSYRYSGKDFSYWSLRIPVLMGVQDNRRNFTLQTGLGLYGGGFYFGEGEEKRDYPNLKTLHAGVQWMLTAGIGPFCMGYSYNLTPLFKLPDGANAYPSSLTFGIDAWYFLSHFIWKK